MRDKIYNGDRAEMNEIKYKVVNKDHILHSFIKYNICKSFYIQTFLP